MRDREWHLLAFIIVSRSKCDFASSKHPCGIHGRIRSKLCAPPSYALWKNNNFDQIHRNLQHFLAIARRLANSNTCDTLKIIVTLFYKLNNEFFGCWIPGLRVAWLLMWTSSDAHCVLQRSLWIGNVRQVLRTPSENNYYQNKCMRDSGSSIVVLSSTRFIV